MEITCNNLSLGYDKHVLHQGVSFCIPSGAYTCVVGENGTGKSTLIKTLLGLIPPLCGCITLGKGLRKEDIGYLPQQTQAQKDFPASVDEVVLSGCLKRMGWRPFYNKAEKARAHQMLEKLGIADLKKHSYNKLSGGQQQRVLLARALCATNKAILLDEPTAGLDLRTTENFYRLLKQLHREGVTIILITHQVDDVLEDADHVLCLNVCGVHCMTKEHYEHRFKINALPKDTSDEGANPEVEQKLASSTH